MSAKKASPSSTSASAGAGSKGFTDAERAAMKARAQELKAEARASKDRAEGERALVAAIDAMQEPDRAMARRLHEIVTAAAPLLSPKTWYGMPAYAKDGEVICYFQNAGKFKARYATFGFSDRAALDEGSIWAVAFALKELPPATETRIKELVRRAVG